MKEYNISVIIPVYNGEKYLNKCVDSIVHQTIFKKIQVIIVDDGSVDNTLQILREYEKKYNNIMVLSIPNGGVSNARNVGLEAASCEYISFVDSDDWVECDCYEKMYRKAQESRADIVAAGFFVSNNNKDILKNCVTNQEKVRNQREMIFDFLIGRIDVHCYNKLFFRKIVEEVRFDTNLKIAEDRLFLFETFLRAHTMDCIPNVFYHYYQNENSTMNNKNVGLNMDGIKVSQQILQKTEILFPDLKPYAEAMYISMVCRTYCELTVRNCKEDSQYVNLRNDIRKYKLHDAVHYMSVKHLIGFLFARVNPKAFKRLRNNMFIKFIK